MPDTPLVSIVTPSYNQAAFLEQTMRSVLEQDYPRLEYLVVDGGSTDGSVEIIQRYADRLAWWVSERDSGQADAINKGLRRAKGEIVAWLNSDDIYLPGAVSAVVSAFQANPQAGLVFGDALAIDEQSQVTNRVQFGEWGLDELLTFRILWQPAVLMRREVLEQAGFLDLNYHYMLDHKLWLSMAQLAGMAHIPQTIAGARFHQAAKNVSQAPGFGREALQLVGWMKTQPELQAAYARLEPRILAGAYRLNGRYLLDGGQPGMALKSYLRSLRHHPPTALAEWHRMVYAALSLIGLQKLRQPYFALRRKLHPSDKIIKSAGLK